MRLLAVSLLVAVLAMLAGGCGGYSTEATLATAGPVGPLAAAETSSDAAREPAATDGGRDLGGRAGLRHGRA